MNCQKCGNILEPTDKFCKNCGEPIATPQSGNATAPNMPSGATIIAPPTDSSIPKIVGPSDTVQNNVPVTPTEPTVISPIVSPASTEPITPVGVEPVAPPQPVVQDVTPQPVNPVPVVPNNLNGTIEQMAAMPNNQNQAAEMPVEEKPKKKNSPILVAILIIAIIGIVGFEIIYFVKPFDKKDNNTNTQETNNQSSEVQESTTGYTAWMNYLLEQDITEITLERVYLENDKKQASLTKENLENTFTELSNYPLIKHYSEGSGFADGDILTISYTVDENNYEVKIANGIIWTDNIKDEKLLAALEESKQTVENEGLKDKEGVFYNYVFNNYSSTILDEYFVPEKLEENAEEVK